MRFEDYYQILGLKPEDVHVIFRMGPGCYGCNGADPVSYDAALLSQAVGKPVRVQLTRKDEMGWENYGFAFVLAQSYATGGWGPNEGFVKPDTDELAESLTKTHSSFETPCGAYGQFKVTRSTPVTDEIRKGLAGKVLSGLLPLVPKVTD